MQILIRRLAHAVVAAPDGRIDHLGAGPFQAALQPLLNEACATGRALVLDFSGVEYISSVGLRVLMIAAHQMQGRPARLVVASLQAGVVEIFAISRFNRVLTVVPTLDDALALCELPPGVASAPSR